MNTLLVLPVFTPKQPYNRPQMLRSLWQLQSLQHSASVSMDPDNILPPLQRQQIKVNMGPTKSLQKKGDDPQHARNKLVQLQEKFMNEKRLESS